MGHCVDGEKLLHPEEALFLVDQVLSDLYLNLYLAIK